MSFEPCRQCKRHVRTEASVCPFCEAPFASPRRSVALGRASRAAIFASATLVGCWTGKAATTTTVDNTTEQSSAGVVEGVVTESGSNTPQANVKVTLMRGSSDWEYNGEKVAETQTDANGRYQFTNVANGQYTIIVEAGRPSRRGWPRRPVQVPPSMPNMGDMVIYPYHPNAEPMPYGAPPARRRVV